MQQMLLRNHAGSLLKNEIPLRKALAQGSSEPNFGAKCFLVQRGYIGGSDASSSRSDPVDRRRNRRPRRWVLCDCTYGPLTKFAHARQTARPVAGFFAVRAATLLAISRCSRRDCD